MFTLWVCLIFPSVFAYEVTTKISSGENTDIFDFPINSTAVPSNNTKLIITNNITITATEKITQPSQTQKIERTLETPTRRNSSMKADIKTNNMESFRPSPQLETYYEFNKFPVVPAIPEAKTFSSFSNTGHVLNSWTEKPDSAPFWPNNQGIQNSWHDNSRNKPHSWDQTPKTNSGQSHTADEESWITRIKFPSPAVKENPYNYLSNKDLNNHPPPVSFPTTTEGFAFNRPVEVPNRNANKASPSLWQKLMGNGNSLNKNAVAVQKTFSDFNIMEKPPHYSAPSKEYETGISSYGSPSPWAKIIKLLTAIIPIGLFISALTPTVITVTSVNDTSTRYRADDPKQQQIFNSLASSLKYAEQLKSCEDKILCELLVTASVSKNSEEHINNLLDTFSEHEDLQNKKEDIRKVFEAVRREDCSSIICKSIKHSS